MEIAMSWGWSPPFWDNTYYSFKFILYSFLAGQDSIPETCQIFEERKSAQIFEVIKLAPALHTYLQGGVENM